MMDLRHKIRRLLACGDAWVWLKESAQCLLAVGFVAAILWLIVAFWRDLWQSLLWIRFGGSTSPGASTSSAPQPGDWLQAWAQVMAGILGVVGAFWVLTIQLRKDRARKLIEKDVETIQFRILLVRDLIKEYRWLKAVSPRPTNEDRRHIYEALAAVSRLYAYLQQTVGPRKLSLAEKRFPPLKVEADPDGSEWAEDNAPALRCALHGAFYQFYESARQQCTGEDDTTTWQNSARNLAIVDSNLDTLYKFFDFTGEVIQNGHIPIVGSIPIVGPSWWCDQCVLMRYRDTIDAIREYEEEN